MMTRWLLMLTLAATACADPPENDDATWQPPPWPEWSERTVRIEYLPDDELHRPENVSSVLVKNPPAYLVRVGYPVSGSYREAFRGRKRGATTEAILEASIAERFSVAQRTLVESDGWRQWRTPGAGRTGSVGKYLGYAQPVFGFYAVTEADVEPMIEAVVRAAERLAREEWNKTCVELRSARVSVRELQAAAAKDKATLDERTATFEQRRRDTEYEDIDEARAAWRSLRQMARAARVDLAGIDAQRKALDSAAARAAAGSDEMRLLIDRLRLEQDVARAGALARQAQIESFIHEARGFVDAFESHQAALHQLQEREAALQEAVKSAAQLVKMLRKLPAGMRPLDLDKYPVLVQKTIFYEEQ